MQSSLERLVNFFSSENIVYNDGQLTVVGRNYPLGHDEGQGSLG